MSDFESWLKALGGKEWAGVAKHHIYLSEEVLKGLIDMAWAPGIPNILTLNGVEYKGKEAGELLSTIAHGKVYWDSTNDVWYPAQVGAHITALYAACETFNLKPPTLVGMFKAGQAWKENADKFTAAMSLMQSAFAAALEAYSSKPAKTRRKLVCKQWEEYEGVKSLRRYDVVKDATGTEYSVEDLGDFTVIASERPTTSAIRGQIVRPTHKRAPRKDWREFEELEYFSDGEKYFRRTFAGCVEVGVDSEGFIEYESDTTRWGYMYCWPCEVEEVPVEEPKKTRKKLTCDIWEVYTGISSLSGHDTIKATDGFEYKVIDLGGFTVIVEGDSRWKAKVVTPTHKRKLKRRWDVFVEGTYIYNGEGYFKRVKNGCVDVGVCPEGFVEGEGTVLRTYVEGWPCEVEEVEQ